MRTSGPNIRGLFPLDLVLLPGERVPLHIFEPRYRALFADCVLTRSEFVIPLVVEDGVAEVACAARIESVMRRFADGRMNVVVHGLRRVRITAAADERPYLTGLVEDVRDLREEIDDRLQDQVMARFALLTAHLTGTTADLSTSRVPFSYAAAGHMQMDSDIKQFLLEERSENARLGIVDDVLTTTIRRLRTPHILADGGDSNNDPLVSE